MANGVNQSCFIRVDDLGRIAIPNIMLKKLGVIENDVLKITATNNLIVIEKCRNDGEDNE